MVRLEIDMDTGSAIVLVDGERRGSLDNIRGPVRPCAILYAQEQKEVELQLLTSDSSADVGQLVKPVSSPGKLSRGSPVERSDVEVQPAT